MNTKTQGVSAAMSDDAAHGLVNPPGMHLMNITRADESTELEPLQGPNGTIGRAWINKATKISGSAAILEGYEPLAKGDVLLTKAYAGDAAARKFVVSAISDGGKWGDRILVDFEALWEETLAANIPA